MPISELDDDILWKIFLINADMDAPRDNSGYTEMPLDSWSALTIARMSSQVCQSWRSILNGSPSIWGRLIHLDCMNQKSDSWRCEVLRRTGEAPLFIKGGYYTAYAAELFFFHVLDAEWTRIRRIDVHINGHWDDRVFQPLLRPSPMLEIFSMTYTNSHESILWTSKSEIFADSAPLLRKYDCPEFAVSLNASWIYQLQDISFSDHFNQVSLLQILQTLKHMKFLQSLQIHFASHFGQLEILTQHPTSSLPYILLPRLQYINLYSTASQSTCLQLLGCITPAPGCTVEFMALHSVGSMDELDESRKIFARLLRNYFILNPPKSFALSTHSYFFKLHNLAPTSAPFYSLFTFAIRYMDWLSSHAEGLFLKSLMESQFVTSLTLLKLTLPDDERHYGSDFLRFTQSLSSLTTLQTGYMTVLYRLCQMPEVQPMPLPALKTLKINELGEVIPDTIHRFIAWRTTCGLPLALLDLTDRQVGVFREEDLRSLEAFVKLKVIWQGPNSIEEYVCGSGSPNRLYFPMRQSPEGITGTEW